MLQHPFSPRAWEKAGYWNSPCLLVQRKNVGVPTWNKALLCHVLRASHCTLQFLLQSLSAVGAHHSQPHTF